MNKNGFNIELLPNYDLRKEFEDLLKRESEGRI